MGFIEDRLRRQGKALHPPQWRGRSVVALRCHGSQLYLSARLSEKAGIAGIDAGTEEASAAGRALAIVMLGELSDRLGTLDHIASVDHVLVLVRSGGDYTDMPKAANGFSDTLVEVLGEAGRHARAAMGVPELAGGALVLVEATLSLKAGIHAV